MNIKLNTLARIIKHVELNNSKTHMKSEVDLPTVAKVKQKLIEAGFLKQLQKVSYTSKKKYELTEKGKLFRGLLLELMEVMNK